MKIHVIPAWVARNKTYAEMVYSDEIANQLKDTGRYLVTYEPQERVCVLDRGESPKMSCYMCISGYSSYYFAAN